jgi:hypothetical protein
MILAATMIQRKAVLFLFIIIMATFAVIGLIFAFAG